jgi:transcriptional regulator with XRE-family HTH domain
MVRANQIGTTLRQCRQARGLSQRALAARAGMTPGAVCNIERGRFGTNVETFLYLLDRMGYEVAVQEKRA